MGMSHKDVVRYDTLMICERLKLLMIFQVLKNIVKSNYIHVIMLLIFTKKKDYSHLKICEVFWMYLVAVLTFSYIICCVRGE